MCARGMLAVFLLEFLEIVCMTKGSKVAEWEAPPFLSTQQLSMLSYGGASTVFSDYTKFAVKGGYAVLRKYASSVNDTIVSLNIMKRIIIAT